MVHLSLHATACICRCELKPAGASRYSRRFEMLRRNRNTDHCNFDTALVFASGQRSIAPATIAIPASHLSLNFSIETITTQAASSRVRLQSHVSKTLVSFHPYVVVFMAGIAPA